MKILGHALLTLAVGVVSSAYVTALAQALTAGLVVGTSEGLRATLVPQFPHLSMVMVLPILLVIDGVLVAAGLFRFQLKALS